MMKATGIVRRIDDLGRVVIPKEIRRTIDVYKRQTQYLKLARYYNSPDRSTKSTSSRFNAL